MTVIGRLAAAEEEGRRDAELFHRDPSAAPQLALGAFSSGCSVRFLVLRRTLLRLHVAPRILAAARVLLRRSHPPAEGGFLDQYAYWHGVRRAIRDKETWRRLTSAPVILMYHAIGERGEQASCYVVPRRRFLLQMLWLRLWRFRVIPLSELVDAIRAHRLPPSRAVVVTFDDGYRDNHQVALPVLRWLRIPATVFLVSDAVGGHAHWTSEPALKNRPLLTAEHVAEMLEASIEVGAHTRTHVSLTDMPPGVSRECEIAGAREHLERLFARAVRVFAYPFGDYDEAVADEVRRAGYRASCCSRSGRNEPATPVFALRRVEVQGTDSLLRFSYMVWSGRRGRSRRARSQTGAPQARFGGGLAAILLSTALRFLAL